MTLEEIYNKYLDDEARGFVIGFVGLCHAIDDIIDGDVTGPEFVIQSFELALTIYTHPFYLKYHDYLYPLIKAATNSYADSVALEKNTEEWAKLNSDILRHAGNDLILACIEICSGREAKRLVSAEVRRLSYAQHHDKKGRVI